MSMTLIPRLRPQSRLDDRRPRPEARRRALAIDDLENRLVLSAAPAAPAPPGPPALVAPPAAASPNTLDFHVNSVSVVNTNGTLGLMANVSLGNVTEQVPLTLTTSSATPARVAPAGPAAAGPAAAGPTASILSLHLAPINLDLLGLDVTTSDICLNITATQGGGLLGTLLYDVDHLLSGGGSLGSILGSLSGTQLTQLTNGLTSALNGALSSITSTGAASFPGLGTGGATPAATTTGTPILDLTLGPVNLNLLGLNVALNNCAGGPITVDITAIPSTAAGGGLLGDLLIDLDGLLDGGTGASLASLEANIVNEIRSLI